MYTYVTLLFVGTSNTATKPNGLKILVLVNDSIPILKFQEAVSSRKRECKCHGPSGSCSSMTCWYELPDMKIIGDRLKELYDNAQLMKWRRKRGNSDGNVDVELFPKALPSRSGSRVNRKTSPPNPLIYVSKSPNFCEPDKKRGILGTSGRQCNRDSEGPDGCKELCCDRGYYSTNQTVRKYIQYPRSMVWFKKKITKYF